MQNQGQAQLLLVPCSGAETLGLADKIHKILRDDYQLGNQVDILHSYNRSSISSGTVKDNRHPLIADFFPDGEVQVDIGRNRLKDIIRGKHVALVEHLFTPGRKVSEQEEQRVSINDHLMTVRGFLDIISKTEVLQTTGVFPYLVYLRAHSIPKYEKRGFFQFDSLKRMLRDFRSDGLNSLITIDPHLQKAVEVAVELELDLHGINPFQSGRAINPYKLGLSGERTKEVLERLRPFQERFKKLKEDNSAHFYLVSVDDGTEGRTENFAERGFFEFSPEEVYATIVYFDKDRVSYTDATTKFKQFSQINEANFDREGTYIIIDDMFASGGTANKVAKILKNLGVSRVEVWTTHAVTIPSQYAKANERKYIDQVVCLDTVPQDGALNVEYIPASADLLAAELYKVHQKLVASR